MPWHVVFQTEHASTTILENHQEWPGRKTAELAVPQRTIVHEEFMLPESYYSCEANVCHYVLMGGKDIPHCIPT